MELHLLRESYTMMCMRITLNIDDAVLKKAARLTRVREKTSLVRMGLEALVSLESAKRLADLGGTAKKLRPIRRQSSANMRTVMGKRACRR